MDKNFNPQAFFASQGQISDPSPYAAYLDQLPTQIPALVKAIQGLMVHLHWATRYGLTLTEGRKNEANLRTVRDRLAKVLELSDAPLSAERPLSKRTVGTCRDFALMLAAALRHQGIPARARAGFGTYFTEGRFEDHWVCEYYLSNEERWVMVDAQLDPFQAETLKIDFDPLDMNRTKFISGPQAWQLCREKRANPKLFGIFNMHGLDFIKGNLLRDFLALNKIEILPWDDFLLVGKPLRKMSPDDKELMDRLSKISTGSDRDFILLRAAFAANQQCLLPDYFFPT